MEVKGASLKKKTTTTKKKQLWCLNNSYLETEATGWPQVLLTILMGGNDTGNEEERKRQRS